MRMFLLADAGKRKMREPFPGADHAVVDGACPLCGDDPFKVGGSGRRPSKDDRAWESDGYCMACRGCVGVLRVEPNTLFGVREDEAVSRLGCRIY